VANEKHLANEIPLNEAGSEHGGDLSRTGQDGSTRSIFRGPTVMMSRKQVNRMMKHQPDRGTSGEYRGSKPLDYEAHEALAQYLAAPEGMGEFKSITAIAEHFKVTRVTVHRWSHNPVVLQRAEWLSKRDWLSGVLFARRSWERVMRAQVKKAITGDTQAARFVQENAWTENTAADDTPVEVTIRTEYVEGPNQINEEGVQ
jgi:hypothetical protein